ncbi:hypothetical protein ABT364_09465 [Massilia sp. SR12]
MIRTFVFAAAFAATAGAQAAPLPCQPQSQINAAAIRERVILVGELHGTKEMPAFVAGLACSLLQQGRQVVLALELPSDLQPDIERYMASDGSEPARQPLYASSFGKLQDGRGSAAYMGLIEQVRVLRQAGAPVSLAATDVGRGPTAAQESGTRDNVMANNIAALARSNAAATVVSLSGNSHAPKQKGGHAGANYEPMGYLLTKHMPTYAISLAHSGGTAWVCMPDCGEHEIDAPARRAGFKVGRYDKEVKVGAISASPPARDGTAASRSGDVIASGTPGGT